jgi:hypothetical protein
MTYVHGLGYLPVVKMKGIYREQFINQTLNESRIYTMTPRLNEMAREYSDQQANITLHLFPQRWEYQSETCRNCMDNGISLGKIKDPANPKKFIKCPACNGTTQKIAVGPYQKTIVRPAKEVIKLVDERIEKHGYMALASINMQFLDKSPIAQSGTAKEVDRDELNTFIYNVAEDIVSFMDDSYKVMNDYRYRVVIEDEKLRAALLPMIYVPQDYSILGSRYLAESVKQARDAKMPPLVIAELEEQFVEKTFYNDESTLTEYRLVMNLDPMPGLSVDEKMSVYQNGGTTKELYIISSNITPFVYRALNEVEGFAEMEYQEQMTILKKYAAELNEMPAAVEAGV